MATVVSFNGTSYTIPGVADQNWGGSSGVDGFLIAVANNSFQKTGGLFTLAADSDFGPTNGLISVYFKSRSSNIASAGILRLAVADTIKWRNNANGGDLALAVNGSDQLTYAGNIVAAAATTGTSGYLLTSNGASSPSYQQLNLASSPAITGQLPFANIANVSANSLLGNNTGSPATPVSLSISQVNTLLGSLSNPMTTLGDTLYGGASGVATRLVGDTSNTRKFLRTLSSGGVAAAPVWDTILNTDLSGIVNAQLSGSAAITNANLASMSNNTIKGNVSGISATPTDLTIAQVLTLLLTAWNAQSASYGIATTDVAVGLTTGSSNFTLTLPTAIGVSGKFYVLGKVDSGTGTGALATTSSQTIGGVASGVIKFTQQNDFMIVYSDNANWQIAATNLNTRSYVSAGVTSDGATAGGATTYQTFTNAPSLTFTPTLSGNYRIEGTFCLFSGTVADAVGLELIATAGSPTLVVLQDTNFNQAVASNVTSVSPFAIYTLAAGTSYTFTLKAKSASSVAITLKNSIPTNGHFITATKVL